MRIAVFGSGAVGGYFGGRLAQAGESVVFIARGRQLQAMRAGGLRVESSEGDFVVAPVDVTGDPAEVGSADAILVAVKAWQVPDAARAMRPMVGANTFVVPLQNGVDAPRELSEVLGKQHVLGGFCRILSSVAEPGLIRHVGVEPYVAFGEPDGRPSERGELLRESFRRAIGLRVEIAPDIRVAMWRKFLLIAALSGVGALTRAPIGVVRGRPETRQMLRQAIEEIDAVAAAHRIGLPSGSVEATLRFIDGMPAEGLTSMQRDIIEGRPSELASQSGAVVRLGREGDVAVPLHTVIYHALLPLELKARGEL